MTRVFPLRAAADDDNDDSEPCACNKWSCVDVYAGTQCSFFQFSFILWGRQRLSYKLRLTGKYSHLLEHFRDAMCVCVCLDQTGRVQRIELFDFVFVPQQKKNQVWEGWVCEACLPSITLLGQTLCYRTHVHYPLPPPSECLALSSSRFSGSGKKTSANNIKKRFDVYLVVFVLLVCLSHSLRTSTSSLHALAAFYTSDYLICHIKYYYFIHTRKWKIDLHLSVSQPRQQFRPSSNTWAKNTRIYLMLYSYL